MNYKNLLIALGFKPKENVRDVFAKKYPQADGYCLEVDFEKNTVDYGNLILSGSKTTQNFSQPENFVVLECVNRLLEKGYKPQNITLEKTWAAGHGTSGRLDICVTRDNGDEYLLIECKTCGREFEKEFARMKNDGGQLFTYFKFSNKADVIMLYTSELNGKEVVYRSEIVKIEDDYRTGDVKDFYERWNKLTKDNGVFDSWVRPYNFESKALTPTQLKPIKQDDSSFIFNSFLEILRHNVVSDKPNAFNKIFTLFLCKVYDEKTTKQNEELRFQWLESKDDDVSFQIRLTNLYKDGMKDFLEKEVTDFSEADFNTEYGYLDEKIKQSLLFKINKLRLEKNNEFAIKEVYDEKSFKENAKIVREVVVLLQSFRLRYNKRQQYLSDFFELLLTTGLKQESGQFFTPVPVAQFIIKSLPIDILVDKKLEKSETNNLLPFLIDYAAGSGHFLTESMHEIQRLIDGKKAESYIDSTARKIKGWQTDQFDWATQYVYGIEKDYRLVKVGKVGCYLHGDGLANVILSDGLANFESTKEYKELLKRTDKDFSQENKQFDILVSNPPYSVSAFKNAAREYYTEKDFELYDSLTDSSSEIECLFVERTKQLLKDGGVAGVILPSSILSNDGIYAKAREIILQYFKIIAVTELGSNTFMATGTNTVVLFLRRRNNYDSINLRKSVERFFDDYQDVTRNGIEKPVARYVNHVWENIAVDDYITLLKKEPNGMVANHEIYREYRKKIKAKTEKDFWNTLVETEKGKLYYFILAYPQKVVLVKTGEKDAEKRFLGYEFSNRRGSEGIHPIQRGKTIEECTRLFDDKLFDNPEKASTYIYKAFSGDYDFPVHESLKDNISRVHLVDMLTFDRENFTKNISMAVKKKVTIESKWDLVRLGDLLFENGKSDIKVGTAKDLNEGDYPFFTSGESILKFNKYLVDNQNIYLSTGGNAIVKFYDGKAAYSTDTFVITSSNEEKIKTKFIFYFLESIVSIITDFYFKGVGLKHLQKPDFRNIQIPLPPLSVQQQIVSEIEVLEKKEAAAKEKIEAINNTIEVLLSNVVGEEIILNKIAPYVGETIKIEKISLDTYITTDNMLQNKSGIIPFVGTPNISSITKYKASDILISNIRPYLKKIWFADGDGGCSKDVLVFRVSDSSLYLPKFVYYMMRRDIFFDYVMEGKKGMKMPRGDKNKIMKYSINVPTPKEQQKIVAEIEKIEVEIAKSQKIVDEIPALKNEVLKKYL